MKLWNRSAETAEIARLREALADRDRELVTLRRQIDDLLDRESMHVYDPDMERLTTAAAIERHGAARARRSPAQACPPGRPDLRVVAGVTELTVTAPRIDRGVWEGFER